MPEQDPSYWETKYHALKARIELCSTEYIITNQAIMNVRATEIESSARRKLCIKVGEFLLREGCLNFTQVDDPQNDSTVFKASVWIVRPLLQQEEN